MVKIPMCSEKENIERSGVLKNDCMFYRGDIMGKVRMSKADRWRKRPCVMKYWEFKDRLVAQAREQKFELGNILHMEFIIEMPKSWSKKKREAMLMKPHQNKPDIDNICKSVLDCLLDNDSTVYSLFAEKYWGLENIIYIENGVKDELLRDK
jgi:Holliday junction resolvase RusA-like endonuclease